MLLRGGCLLKMLKCSGKSQGGRFLGWIRGFALPFAIIFQQDSRDCLKGRKNAVC
jgi:hypothetical protein